SVFLLTLGIAVSPYLGGAVQAQSAAPQQATARPPLRLQDIEQIAFQKNPTLAQAEAAIRSAEGRRRQAGAYPNPTVSFSNNEISYGPIIRGGEYGIAVQQQIVLGGKLGLNKNIAEQEIIKSQAQAEAQKLRVLNSVRALFSPSIGRPAEAGSANEASRSHPG